jgi:23S rRNA pseudouridine1911/1915/1917 synthase
MGRNRGYSFREQVHPRAAGQSVLAYLTATHRHSSEQEWSGRLSRGEVEVDGARAEALAPLRAGQALVWHRPPWDEPDVPTDYALLHEDEALLAVSKPRGLPTLPGGGFVEGTLLTLVRSRFPEASPLHRLGRETSGVVLFSRTHAAGSALARSWREHEVEKRYRALGSGVAGQDLFDIAAPIGPRPHDRLGTVHAAHPQGKPSHSVARVLERRADSTLFEVDISTGRPHQIRIHLAFAGHPLVGDPLYGPGGLPKAQGAGLPGDGGYFLHAEQLAFVHPLTREPLVLRAAIPEELLARAER